MKLSDQILYELITKNVASKKALQSLSRRKESVDAQIDALMRDEMIREIKLSFKYGNKRYGRRQETIYSYVLTKEGVRYAIRRLGNRIPWITNIEFGVDSKLRVMGKEFSSGRESTKRYMLITAVAVICDVAGMNESVMFVGGNESTVTEEIVKEDVLAEMIVDGDVDEIDLWDEYEDLDILETVSTVIDNDQTETEEIDDNVKCNTLSSYVLPAWDKRDEKQSTATTFTSAYDIKHKWALQNTNKTQLDIKIARFAGIVSSAERTAIVYATSDGSALGFRRHALKVELSLYEFATRHILEKSSTIDMPESILMVTSPKSLESTYDYRTNYLNKIETSKNLRSMKNSWQKKKAIEYWFKDCGDDFSHMWVVPISYAGAYELHSLMNDDIDDEAESIINALLVGDEVFYRNEQTMQNTFPLCDELNNLYSIGIHMDVPKIRRMEKFAGKNPDTECFVLCQKWQLPYYAAILNHTKPVLLSDYIDYKDVHLRGSKIPLSYDKEAQPHN